MSDAPQLWPRFAARAGLDEGAVFPDVVEAVRRIPYGRPTDRSAKGVVREWRGTCSTKHELIASLAKERWSDLDPRIVHRTYRLTPAIAHRLFGSRSDGVVPEEGVVDVHTYLTAVLDGRRVVIDATVPGAPWDGRSDMPLACGEGTDVEGGPDPRATKARLVAATGDSSVRDRVIEALSD